MNTGGLTKEASYINSFLNGIITLKRQITLTFIQLSHLVNSFFFNKFCIACSYDASYFLREHCGSAHVRIVSYYVSNKNKKPEGRIMHTKRQSDIFWLVVEIALPRH